MGVVVLCAGDLLCFRGEVFCCVCGKVKGFFLTLFHTKKIFTMSGAATEYLSPDDVSEFCGAILDAGLNLGTLLTAKYPRAEQVCAALYVVMEIVGDYGLEGEWVTTWASKAKSEFVATSEVQKVSGSVALLNTAFVFLSHLLNILFRLLCRRSSTL